MALFSRPAYTRWLAQPGGDDLQFSSTPRNASLLKEAPHCLSLLVCARVLQGQSPSQSPPSPRWWLALKRLSHSLPFFPLFPLHHNSHLVPHSSSVRQPPSLLRPSFTSLLHFPSPPTSLRFPCRPQRTSHRSRRHHRPSARHLHELSSTSTRRPPRHSSPPSASRTPSSLPQTTNSQWRRGAEATRPSEQSDADTRRPCHHHHPPSSS